MKKQFYSKLLFLFALLLTVSTSAWAETVTYVFTSKSWAATVNNSAANWISGKDGLQITSGQGIQVSTGVSGANGTSPESFSNIESIVVRYCTNASSGAGAIKVQVGSGDEKSFSVKKPSSGGKTLKNAEFTFDTPETGAVKITAECTTNSVFIYSVTITYIPSGATDKTDSDFALVNAPIELNFDLYDNSAAQVISYTSSSTGAVTVSGSEYVETVVDETNKKITVTPVKKTPSEQTITVSQDADDNYNAGETTFKVSIADSTPKTGKWKLTDLTELTADDVFVIVGNNGSNYAMSNNKGTSSAPSAVAVTINNDEITSDVDDNIKWNISGNATDGYTFYPDGTTLTWLYCTNANNGVRVGEGDAKNFAIHSSGYLYTSQTTDTRYLGIYNSQDWRCYTNTTGNITDQTFAFFKYVSLSPLKSIAVTGAPTTFHQGDAFSHEGAVVTATYENETTEDVTASAEFSTPDMTTVGVKTVTVSYSEGDVNMETTYDINVLAPAVLTEITLSGEYPTAFNVGDVFSHGDIVVTASYDDNSIKDVTGKATFTGYDMSAKGEQTVTVSYTEGEVTKTATYDINLSLKPGTKALPYTVDQAIEAIDNHGDVNGVYATGIVSEIVTAYSTTFNNITFDISVDGTTTSKQLRAFRCKSGDAEASDIKKGDIVVICGNLIKYGLTDEFDTGNELVSRSPEVSITTAANATWVAPAKVKITSDDVTVYTVEYIDGKSVVYKHKVDDKVIPANKAVLLTSSKGEATTVKIAVTDEPATDYEALENDNDLLASDGTIQGAAYIFCLAVGDNGLGFYPVSDEIYVPAGKAYLLIPAAQAAPSYLWFNGDTTAIDSLTTDTAAGNENGEIYSLTGQRVGKNYRGIVIMNGRKVLKK